MLGGAATAVRRSTPTPSWPRRSSRSRPPRTDGSPCRASEQLERRTGHRLVHLAEGSEEEHIAFADTRPGRSGDHQPEWSGQRERRAPLCAVHRQRRTEQALAHPDRAHALLPRPRLDARDRRDPADLPAAAGHVPGSSPSRAIGAATASWVTVRYLTRTRSGRSTPSTRTTCSCSRSPAAARRVDKRRRTPRRSACATTTGSRPRTATASWSLRAIVRPPDAGGHRVRLPRPGAHGERAENRATGRRGGIHNSLTRIMVKPTPPHRRLRPAVLRVQLPRPDGQPARRGHRHPPAQGQKVEY